MARQLPWVWEVNNNLYCFLFVCLFAFCNSTTTLARKSLTQFLFLYDKCALPVYIKFKKCVGYELSHCITSFMPMVLAVQVGSTSLILHVTILWIWLPENHCNIV